MNPVVTLKKVAAVLPFIGKEETRYYLTGFYVEPHKNKGVILVGTDGHTMGVAYDPDGKADKPVIWKPSRCLIAAAKSYKPVTEVQFEDEDSIEKITTPTDGEMVELTAPSMGSEVDGKFPDWRKVVCPITNAESREFNAEYLIRFAGISSLLGGLNMTVREFARDGNVDKLGARFISAKSDDSFVGLIMPMKTTTSSISLPDWLTTP